MVMLGYHPLLNLIRNVFGFKRSKLLFVSIMTEEGTGVENHAAVICRSTQDKRLCSAICICTKLHTFI
jgi:hypothetical protein